VGYTKGHPSAEAALTLATRKLGELIARIARRPRLLLRELLRGREMGQTIPELARLVRDVGAAPDRFGLLIDTCHLHAAGFDLSGETAGQQLADALSDEGVLEARGRLPPQRLPASLRRASRSARHAGRGHHRHGP